MTFTHPPRLCPRCSGLLYPDYDRDLCCLACGEVLYCTPAVELFRTPPVPQAHRGRPLLPARSVAQLRTRDYNREYQRRRRARRPQSA